MAAKRKTTTRNAAATRAKTASELTPTPPVPHVGRLETINDIKDEYSRLYRGARTGKLDPAKAAKLGYLLSQIVALIRDTDLETRISALEKATGART